MESPEQSQDLKAEEKPPDEIPPDPGPAEELSIVSGSSLSPDLDLCPDMSGVWQSPRKHWKILALPLEFEHCQHLFPGTLASHQNPQYDTNYAFS